MKDDRTVQELMAKRRSTRKYSEGYVTRQDLADIVKAGVDAPSGANSQNQRFVIVTSKAALKKLGARTRILSEASAAVAVYIHEGVLKFPVGEESTWEFLAGQNAAASMQNMTLLATAKGIGSCWVSCSDQMDGSRILNGHTWADLLPKHPAEWRLHGILALGTARAVDDDGYPAGDVSHNHRPVKRKHFSSYSAWPEFHLAITGSFGGGDIGDEAMLTMHLRNLDAMGFPRKNIRLAGHQVKYTSWYHEHPAELCEPSKAFPRESTLEWADALLVTGGGTINTRGAEDANGKSIKRVHGLVMPFVRAGKPVFLSGQTVGPLGINAEHDALAKELIEAVDVLTVRDTLLSRECIERIGAKPKLLVETVDDAAHLPYEDVELPESVVEFVGRAPTVAVNVTTYTSDTLEKRQLVVRLCNQICAEGNNVVLVPHHPRDFTALLQVRDLIASTCKWSRVSLIDTREWRAPEIKKLISLCVWAVGGRYHFLVFALTAGTICRGHAGNEYSRIKQLGIASACGVGQVVSVPNPTLEELLTPPLVGLKPPPPCKSFEAFNQWLAEIESR